MDYNSPSRFPQKPDPRFWLVLASLILSGGLTIAGYAFHIFLDISPAGVQIHIEGNPDR
jgi:hypothetical protein